MDAIPFLFFSSIGFVAVMAVCTEVPRIQSSLALFAIVGRGSGIAVQRMARQAKSRLDVMRTEQEEKRAALEEERAERLERVRRRQEDERATEPEPPARPRNVLLVYENRSKVARPVARFTPAKPPSDTPAPVRAASQAASAPPPPETPRREQPEPTPALRPVASVNSPVPPAPPERFVSVRQPERAASQTRPEEPKTPRDMESEPGRDVFARLADASRFNEDDAATSMDEIPADDRIPSSLIVFLHVTGGAGATTMAVNTAASLAGPRRNCCLIDLDVQFGGVASLMDLPPQPALQALVQDPRRLERVTLESMLVRHNTGVHVLTAPRVPIPLHGLKASSISELVRMATSRFTYVVVDLPLALTTWTDAVLKPARFVYLVTPMTVQAAHRTARVLHLMKQQELGQIPLKIVANRYNSEGDSAIGPKQFAKAIGRNVDHLLPNDYELVLQSHNQGVPAVKLAPKSKFSLAVGKMLADDLNEAPAGGQPQRRLAGFDRL